MNYMTQFGDLKYNHTTIFRLKAKRISLIFDDLQIYNINGSGGGKEI